jgi:hypothetical protein
MCSVERARKAETEKSDAALEGFGGGEDGVLGLGFDLVLGGREEARKERTEAMVKKRRGAAEEEERREVGEALAEEEEEVGEETAAEAVVEVVEEESVEERNEVVGSREFWRWSRFDSISKND